MIPYTLNGSFDLHITDYCNLHCKGCVVLDYNQSGEVTNEKYTLDNVIDVISNLKKFNLKLEELKILGGEPTLHTDLNQIIDYIKSTNTVEKLTLVTNGLNFTQEVVECLTKLDRIIISIYPMSKSIESVFSKSKLGDMLSSKVHIDYLYQEYFFLYGYKQDGLEYNTELNWKRCLQKNDCRVINLDGLYRCTITYSEKKNLCEWNNRQEIIDFIESDIPLSHCKDCPMPAKTTKWETNNSPIDLKNSMRGLNLIKTWSQK